MIEKLDLVNMSKEVDRYMKDNPLRLFESAVVDKRSLIIALAAIFEKLDQIIDHLNNE